MLRSLLPVTLVLATMLCGCPGRQPAQEPVKQPAAVSVPADDPLTAYGKLKLGMDSLGIARAYPAPDGKGDGYTRVIEDYDAVSNHLIRFEAVEKVKQLIVLRVFRDQVVKLVDRRDGLTAAQADAWLAELKAAYGEPQVIRPDVQWSWGDPEKVLLTFTRDNAFEDDMSANVVLEYRPGYDASVDYLRLRETAKP